MTWKEKYHPKNGTHCAYCGRPFSGKKARRTQDHIVPRILGGKDGFNRVAACLQCNQDKGRLPLLNWIAVLEVKKDSRAKGAWKVYNRFGKKLGIRRLRVLVNGHYLKRLPW